MVGFKFHSLGEEHISIVGMHSLFVHKQKDGKTERDRLSLSLDFCNKGDYS